MALLISRGCREFKDSRFIVPTAILIAFLKPTLVSPFTDYDGLLPDDHDVRFQSD